MGWGSPQATYTAGQVINVRWWIQVNHGGRIGVKLCPRTNPDQACFDQYPLTRSDVNDRYMYIMNGASMGTRGEMSANFRLPSGVSYADGCVLLWKYLTMNSCFESCNRAVCGVYADRQNPVTGQRNMGTCCLGSGCSPANAPEVFRNCANIVINNGGTPPTPPPSTGKCEKCNIPVASGGCKCDNNCDCISGPTPPGPGSCSRTAASGGSCGGGTCCPTGQCCSQWGWCGTTSGHCGAGCQRSWGTCWSDARAARAAARANATATAAAATAASAGSATTITTDATAAAVTASAPVVDVAAAGPDAEAGAATMATDAGTVAAAAEDPAAAVPPPAAEGTVPVADDAAAAPQP